MIKKQKMKPIIYDDINRTFMQVIKGELPLGVFLDCTYEELVRQILSNK